jgi:hypothetical protein
MRDAVQSLVYQTILLTAPIATNRKLLFLFLGTFTYPEGSSENHTIDS